MIDLIRVAVEENSKGTMVHIIDMPGAFTRGKNLSEALSKINKEVYQYKYWESKELLDLNCKIEIIQREKTSAQLDDGDTEILTLKEKSLDTTYFEKLKKLAIKSATDFQKLYDSIPNKTYNDLSKNRETFYGKTPSNANEMLFHVDEVKSYYLSRINIEFVGGVDDFTSNRIKSIELIEKDKKAKFNNLVSIDNELWTTSKVLRRFIWHDRIHARALYRFAIKTWGEDVICDAFNFNDFTT